MKCTATTNLSYAECLERLAMLPALKRGERVNILKAMHTCYRNTLKHIARKGRCPNPRDCAAEALLGPDPDYFT